VIYPFGKSFTRWFIPLVDDASIDSLPTSQTPTIYIFDSQPSRSAALGGSGSVQSVVTWTWDSTKNGWSYTVAAIDDPDQATAQDLRTYWEAVNYKLETGEQTQVDVRSFQMQRVTGHATTVGVTDAVLKEYFPQLDTCSSPSQRVAYVELAIEDVKSKLKSKGYDWARISRPDRLQIAIAYKVLYMIMLVQLQQGNDKYAIKYTEFKANYDAMIDGLSLEYDSNNDGLPDVTIRPSTGPIWVIR
jgi:hypothetical protein